MSAVTKMQPPPPEPSMPVTEDTLALAFVREHKDRARYDHSLGRWFLWDGTTWRRNDKHLATEWIREIYRAYSLDDDTTAKRLGTASAMRGVERLASVDPAVSVTSEVWDVDPWLLGTPGGVVDLRTGRLMPAAISYMITKRTVVAPTGGAPKRWLAFLREATGGDGDLIGFLQRLCGYCLTGSIREQVLSFIYGDGENGKSVFLNTLRYIMGEYAHNAAIETFTASFSERHPTELAALQGARLVTAAETEQGRSWAESRIKTLTGGDPITARLMRQDFFTFTPTFKLVIIGNHKPKLTSVDRAMSRRVRLIPFEHHPKVKDPDLELKLREEAGAILSWMIEGCTDWDADGLMAPDSVIQATGAYLSDEDTFGEWIDLECASDEKPIHLTANSRRTSVGLLYGSWNTFCEGRGEKPGSHKRFSQELEKRGYLRDRTATSRSFVGIALRGTVKAGDPL